MTATVLQCDREATEEAYLTCYEDSPNEAWLAALIAGKHDDDVLLQLLTRHRHDSTREMAEALRKCRAQFEFYVQSHSAKQPPDTAKAATNQSFVQMIDEALKERT